jgi:hypothetical protein
MWCCRPAFLPIAQGTYAAARGVGSECSSLLDIEYLSTRRLHEVGACRTSRVTMICSTVKKVVGRGRLLSAKGRRGEAGFAMDGLVCEE